MHRPYRHMADINVTNLVDVVLVLLIIFMITAPMLQSGIDINLPKTRAAVHDELGEGVVLTVDRKGGVFINDVWVRLPDFEKKLDETEEIIDIELPAGVGEKINDPVRMYLREMGTVPLLTREGEVEIAKRIERGQNRVLKALSRSPIVIRELLALGEDLKKGVRSIKEVVTFDEEEITEEVLMNRLKDITGKAPGESHELKALGDKPVFQGVEHHQDVAPPALFCSRGVHNSDLSWRSASRRSAFSAAVPARTIPFVDAGGRARGRNSSRGSVSAASSATWICFPFARRMPEREG